MNLQLEDSLIDFDTHVIRPVSQQLTLEFILRSLILLDGKDQLWIGNDITITIKNNLEYTLIDGVHSTDLTYSEIVEKVHKLDLKSTYVSSVHPIMKHNLQYAIPCNYILHYDNEELSFSSAEMVPLLRTVLEKMEKEPQYNQLIKNRLSQAINNNDKKLKQRMFKENTLSYGYLEFLANLHQNFMGKLASYSFNQLNNIKTKYKDFEAQLQRMMKYTKNITLDDLYFVEDKEDSTLTTVIEKKTTNPKCDVGAYKQMVESTDIIKEYGPLVGTLIYLGCVIDEYHIPQLQNTWITMKRQVEEYLTLITWDTKLQFAGAVAKVYYYQFQLPYSYEYCTSQFNFISQYFMGSYCNCECGTLFAYKLCQLLLIDYERKMKIKPDIRFGCVLTQNHIQLIIDKQPVGFETFIFETTIKSNYPDSRLKETGHPQFFVCITNERVLALYVIVVSVLLRIREKEEAISIKANSRTIEFLRQLVATTLKVQPFKGESVDFGAYLYSINYDFITEYTDIIALIYTVFMCYVHLDGRYEDIFSFYTNKGYTNFFRNRQPLSKDQLEALKVEFIDQFQKDIIERDIKFTDVLSFKTL